MNKFLTVIISFCCIFWVSCGKNTILTQQGGGGVETVAIRGKAIDESGKPVASARVLLRLQNYLKDTSEALSGLIINAKFDTQTDDSGYFTIDSLAKGLAFALEINDGKSHASFTKDTVPSDSTVYRVKPARLLKTGTIIGSIDSTLGGALQWYAQIPGLERVSRVIRANGMFTLTDIPQGAYSVRIVSSSSVNVPVIRDSITVMSDSSVYIPFALLKNVRRCYLNTTQNGASIANALYGFPILIRLTKSNFDFSQVQNDGSDLRFTKSDNTPLSFEIERFDRVSEIAEIWVKMDTVCGNDSTQYVKLTSGLQTGLTMSLLSNSTAVFDTGNGFQAVWHMKDVPGSTVLDATINRYNGTPFGLLSTSLITGAVGNAYAFDGKSSYIAIDQHDSTTSKLNFPENGYYTVSAWVNLDTLNTVRTEVILDKGSQRPSEYVLTVNTDKTFGFMEYGTNPVGWNYRLAPASVAHWLHVVGVKNGIKQYIYVNGVCIDSMGTFTSDTYTRGAMGMVAIGRNAENTPNYLKGIIDEVRIENTSRSADWIKLCAENQGQIDRLVRIR